MVDINDLTNQELTYYFGMVKAFRLMGVTVVVAKEMALADIDLIRANAKYDEMMENDPGYQLASRGW